MPLYEYLCHKCGKRFDVLQKFSDEPLTVHEEDGGDVERLVSAPAFHFKGTGWYVTDYAKSNGVSSPNSEGKGSESKSDGGETKAEAKPAETKTDTAAKPTAAASAASDK